MVLAPMMHKELLKCQRAGDAPDPMTRARAQAAAQVIGLYLNEDQEKRASSAGKKGAAGRGGKKGAAANTKNYNDRPFRDDWGMKETTTNKGEKTVEPSNARSSKLLKIWRVYQYVMNKRACTTGMGEGGPATKDMGPEDMEDDDSDEGLDVPGAKGKAKRMPRAGDKLLAPGVRQKDVSLFEKPFVSEVRSCSI
jgi:hypothetical protein